MTPDESAVPRWARWCGVGAIAAALPTVVWRVVVGAGATLGTPAWWRRAEHLPGWGTAYVCGLSLVQLVAALATLVLIVPGADRVPRWSPVASGRRMPLGFVVGLGAAGAALLAVICLLSALNWSKVNPFRGAAADSGWAYLAWACYAAAPLWPVLLVVTLIGYDRARRRAG